MISRRELLGAVALGSAAGFETPLPTRVLGRTGERVSILGFGAGSRFQMYKEEDQALHALNFALDLGITYIDTADDYSNGLSEQRVGKVLKARGRKSVFLATKLSNRDPAQARRTVETSLRNLQMDQIDLIHVHHLTDRADLAGLEAKGGVIEQLLKFRDEKLTRFAGITSHSDPEVLRTALEHHDFDCTQMALNAALVGMTNGHGPRVANWAGTTSFEKIALPVANRKKMGVIAMKVMAQDGLIGPASPEKLLYYAQSLPVTTAIVGMPKLEQIEANVRLAKAFKPLPESEMRELSTHLAKNHKAALDRFFSRHIDA
jgi:predicted aldo/keto reductase-like oxidoreductase